MSRSMNQPLSNRWLEYYEGLSSINERKNPRWIQTTKGREIELIRFADASELGYGAGIYVRCASGSQIWCNLLTAKTKVAPVKTTTIPRLELCAAELLAKILTTVRKKCELEYADFSCYSDSSITLNWISKCPSTLKIYAATRVKNIQSKTPIDKWYYVPSKLNPADIASRGMKAQELIECDLWWHGPSFIYEPRETRQRFRPELANNDEKIIQAERKPIVVGKITLKEPPLLSIKGITLIDRFSSWPRIIRITAYVQKACEKFKLKKNHQTSTDSADTIGLLTTVDLEKALIYWVKSEQIKHLKTDYFNLKHKNEADKSSSILQLSPFVDTNQIGKCQHHV